MNTLADLNARIRAINTAKGWRSLDLTWGDWTALLHTEISEMVEAYRDHQLADATDTRPCVPIGDVCGTHRRHITHCDAPRKPEGVAAELADVTIRVFDMTDATGIDIGNAVVDGGDMHLSAIPPMPFEAWKARGRLESFGDWCSMLHHWADRMWESPNAYARTTLSWTMLRAITAFANQYRIDLTAEVERKMAYNDTRPYLHGGRTLTGGGQR